MFFDLLFLYVKNNGIQLYQCSHVFVEASPPTYIIHVCYRFMCVIYMCVWFCKSEDFFGKDESTIASTNEGKMRPFLFTDFITVTRDIT